MKIQSVELYTENLDNLGAFYSRQLGLSNVRDAVHDHLTVTVGASHLTFRHKSGFAGRYHFAFNIPENRLLAAQAFLTERDVTLIADSHGTTTFDFETWNAHALYFYDPAGNIVECIARHELPNTSSLADNAPFTPTELLNISEIGLPCTNNPTLAALISHTCAIAPYPQSSPTFLPLGDANGLFILVPEGRTWFPDTGIPAEGLPIHVQFTDDTNTRFALTGVPYHVQRLPKVSPTQNP